MEGTVELIKDSASYVVISLPDHGPAVGFAASKDCNTLCFDAGARFEVGQAVSATVTDLPSPATGTAAAILGGHSAQAVAAQTVLWAEKRLWAFVWRGFHAGGLDAGKL